MLKEAIATAETVLLAQEAACKLLGVQTHEAEFEILEMPTKKILGLFGGKEAKVRAYININPAESAKKYLMDIFDKMEVNGIDIDYQEVEDGAHFTLSGDSVKAVIGRRGETLDALQYLAGLVANQVEESYYRLTLDTGNYREKREQTLDKLGKKVANKVLRTGKIISLEPMNPYERRIIHSAVQTVEGATSWSEGEGTQRHIVIGLDPKERQVRYNKFSNRGDFKKPYKASNNRGYAKKEADNESKTKQSDTAPLYGKVSPNN